ncbi:MAG: O-antigen ligase family protein [Desulfitobacteriaceae bacterium]
MAKFNTSYMRSVKVDVDVILFFLLLAILAALPLITHTVMIQHISPTINNAISDTGSYGDVVVYYKFIFLIITTIVLIGLFLYKMVVTNYTIKSSYINLPVTIMFLLIISSMLFSDYKTISVFGDFHRHQGALTFLSYLLIFIIASNTVFTKRKLRLIFHALIPLILVNTILSVINFYGYNIWPLVSMITFSFPTLAPGSFFGSTFGHPNHLSGIGSVLTLLFSTKAILTPATKDKILNILLSTLSFTMVLCSLSTSGFLTILIFIPLLALIVYKAPKSRVKLLTIISIIVLFSFVFITLNFHNNEIWNNSIGYFTNEGDPNSKKQTYNVKPKQLDTAKPSEQLDDVDLSLPTPGVGPGNGRLYIWKKTIELINKRPLLGYGLDTLGYYFPQGDSAKISNIGGGENVFVDKPHNTYLGFVFGLGLPFLLVFALLIFRHFWEHIKIIKNYIDDELHIMIMSLFIGWFAYLFQGLINDPIASTAPVFWVLFGVNVSILRELKELKNS